MSAYILVATALVLISLVAWLWESGERWGEPAQLLLLWLVLGALTAIIAAAGIWIEDATVSLSFSAAARLCSMVLAFLLFLFTRSFSIAADYTILFWSIPLQLGMAVILVNWQHLFEFSGGHWILDMGDPASVVSAVVNWFYGIMALWYTVILYLTLRREGREREKGRTLMMITAIAVLIAATAVRGTVSGVAGYAINAAYLGHLAGVLLLVLAFRGPIIFKAARR